MKYFCALMVFALLAGPAFAADNALSPKGLWRTEKRDGVVEIYRCGNAWCGRVVNAAILRTNPRQRDVKNPDPSLRGRPVKGLVVLKGFKGGPRQWSGGPLYDPDTGDGARNGRLRLRDPNTLEVRGCIALLLCRTQIWKRLDSA